MNKSLKILTKTSVPRFVELIYKPFLDVGWTIVYDLLEVINLDSKKVGSFIAKLRKEQGYTQTSLAEILNVSNRTVSKWENGDGYPDITILPEIAKALNITVDELLYGEKFIEKDKEKNSISKSLNDSKIWFILSFFFGIFGALLGTITEAYCIWAFSILFYTHWEIMFGAVSLFAEVVSIITFVFGVYRVVPDLNVKTFNEYCRNNIIKFLTYFAIWFSFPFSFLMRIFFLSRFGYYGIEVLIVLVAIYIIVNVRLYEKYK